MLVIRRRAGEALLLAGGIEIRVLELSSQRVQLGIVAPAAVWVLREEVAFTRASNRAAASEASLESLRRWAGSLRRDGGPNPGGAR